MSMNDLERIAPLVKRAQIMERNIKEADEAQKKRKADLRKLLDIEIPELMMNELGLSFIKTDDGASVEVFPFVDARIPVKKQGQAFGWLRENGFGDLIKHQVISQFAAGEDAEATAVMLYLESSGYSAEDKTTVHPMTLKAWVREQDGKGTEIPEDLFGVYRGMTTKIKS